jgi:hypothetical protein
MREVMNIPWMNMVIWYDQLNTVGLLNTFAINRLNITEKSFSLHPPELVQIIPGLTFSIPS